MLDLLFFSHLLDGQSCCPRQTGAFLCLVIECGSATLRSIHSLRFDLTNQNGGKYYVV